MNQSDQLKIQEMYSAQAKGEETKPEPALKKRTARKGKPNE